MSVSNFFLVGRVFFNKKCITITLLVILYCYLLSTSLLNGFWWDDIVYSLQYGALKLADQSLWEHIFNEILIWSKKGRLFPVAVVQGNLIQFLGQGEREITRAIQFALVFINILQVIWFTNRITRNFFISSLTALFFITLVQYRISPGFNYVEPVSGLASMMQFCFFFSMASIHSAYSGLEKLPSKSGYFLMILSAILALISTFTYEIGLVSFLAVGLMVLLRTGFFNILRSFRLNVYNLAGLAIYVFITFYIRLNGVSYSGIAFGKAKYFFHGFFVQLFGSLPLTYALVIDHPRLLESWSSIIFDKTFIVSFTGISLFILVVLLFSINEIIRLSKYDLAVLGIVSITFFVVPCISMGLSAEYQRNQSLGMAYLPVYFSYFGMALILGGIFIYLIRIQNWLIRVVPLVILALFISFFGGFHAYYNERIFDFIENASAYERDAVFESLKVGFMKNIGNDSVVFSKIRLLYNTQDQFRQLAACVLQNPPYFLFIESPHELPAQLYEDKTIYLLEGEVYRKNGAWLALMRLDLTEEEKKNIGQTNLCEKDGRYIRLINLTSRKNRKRRTFFFGEANKKDKVGSNAVVFDSNSMETRPIVGNILRSIFNQDRLSSEYQSVELSKFNLKPCSLRVLETGAPNEPSSFFKSNHESGSYSSGTLFHRSFEEVFEGDYTSNNSFRLKDDFSVELLVKPNQKQVSYAHIIGNHPGYHGFEGFALQQDASHQNEYTFGFGNGKRWLPSVRFKLRQDQWNYLALVVKENTISGYVNGDGITSVNVAEPIKNSSMPISIGNWFNRDRPFSGFIKEIRISDGAVKRSEIESTWQSIKEALW